MKKHGIIWLLLIGVTFLAKAQYQPVYFTAFPTIDPAEENIVFVLKGDLWQVPVSGGNAVRLTALEGQETLPRFSPDGKWLAFTSDQFGNDDVFLMERNGGAIRQLTFHDASDQVASWSWDSQSIYFTSARYNRHSSYRVNIAGGTPERVFGDNYFQTDHQLAAHPVSGEFFFSETWESSIFANRKRYKGAYNPDVQSYNPTDSTLKKYTDWEGKDFWVTIDKNGNIYFVSDEANGEYNLYTLKNGNKTQLTNFETSIKNPQVSASGNKIVFEKDYQLFVYDVASGQSTKVNIQVPALDVLVKEQDFSTSGKITAYDVAPDNKKLAFVSRGRIFISDVKGKFTQPLPTRPQERVMEVHWLKDNKTVLYSQTVDGYLNWFTQPATGEGPELQLTQDAQNNRDLTFNSDRSQAVYFSGREEVRLLDLADFTSKTIVRDELWALYNPAPYFSPDDAYVVFTAIRAFERDILVHHLASGTTTNLTQTALTETNPFWSPDGKYLYFLADRKHPGYPYGVQDPNLYRLPLQQFDEPFRATQWEKLFEEDEEKEEDESEKKKDKKKDKEEAEEDEEELPEVKIDTTHLIDRWEELSPTFGFQNNLVVFKKDEEIILLFASNHEGGKNNLYKTVFKDFEEPETKKIEGAATSAVSLRMADDNYYLLFGGKIHSLNVSDNKVEAIDIDYTFRKNLRNEFTQMFYETWANMEENFYDKDFHGVDWLATRKEYAAFLPFVNERNDLRTLINDMLGELNTSHFGFYSFGDEEDTHYASRSLNPGIIFEKNAPFTVKEIIPFGPADKEGKDINPGDVLIKVNSTSVQDSINREFYFLQPSMDEEMKLTFQRGTNTFDVLLHPAGSGTVSGLLYDQWIAQNQRTVDSLTDKKVAYVYMKNMSGSSLEDFYKEMTSEAYRRDALILDLRYNTGGNVHDEVLRFLRRKSYLQWKYREGKLTPQSNFSPADKPMVLLINKQTLSDGEMTATGWKALELGPVIGTETYRWIIFTTGKSLVDGSFYRLPSWGCYTLDGADLEITGVAPDIPVEMNFKHRQEHDDPQLKRAVEEILQQL